MPILTALALTPFARDWLATTTAARVLNVFDRACNLINQDEAILALVTSTHGLNPFAMVVASAGPMPYRGVSATSVVSVAGNQLTVGPLHVNVESASVWNPRPDWPELQRTLADTPAQLEELVSTAMELAIGGSLLDLYLAPALGTPFPDAAHRIRRRASGWGVRQQALLDRARRGATELVHGLLTYSAEQCLVGAKALAGLGGGLTPAGDDFIVGMMLAAWAGLYGSGAEALCRPMAEAAAPLTTTLSAAYLRAAARGECMAQWHVLFEALLRSNVHDARVATQSLLSVGHTSGADALAGFLAVHEMALGLLR
jgi:uncharacterized protein DUF2877